MLVMVTLFLTDSTTLRTALRRAPWVNLDYNAVILDSFISLVSFSITSRNGRLLESALKALVY